MKRKYFLFFTFLFINAFVFADGIDSLKARLNQNPDDTTCILLYTQLSDLLSSSNIDEAKSYSNRALRLSDSINYKRGLYKAFFSLGYCEIVNGEYKKAIETYSKAIAFTNDLNKPELLPQLYNRLAGAYYYLGDYENALKIYFETVKKSQDVSNVEFVISGYSGIGNIYFSKNEFNNALRFYREALSQKNNDLSIRADLLNNIASVYTNKRELDSAINYYAESLEMYKKMNDSTGIGLTFMNLANAYVQKKNYEKSIGYINDALSIFQKESNVERISRCYFILSEIYQEKSDLTNALIRINEAIKYIENTEYKELQRDVYKKASEIYAGKPDFEKAYFYFKKYSDLNDTLLNVANSESMNRLSTEFETEKKENEIKQLNVENKNKDLQRNFMIAVSVLGLVVTFFVYRLYREKKKVNKDLAEKNMAIRKQKQEIESQKAIVDLQNKEITDSINYARQIQTAILPSTEQISKSLPEHFVLYKPKAIVSGDFYFFTERAGKIIMAVVDCTGHGVPGAFMSMIGHNLLDQIIIENGITSPAAILNQLHVGVRKMLQQNDKGTGNRDGMDIALVAIDKSKNSIEFAGANRPIYCMSDNNLTEITSNKYSIGGFQAETERKFTNHLVPLKKGDVIYLFSDGYADQFGGPKGKKFMVRNLQKTFRDLQDLSMKEQHTKLSNVFDQWSGSNEQVDDVLVVGIKI